MRGARMPALRFSIDLDRSSAGGDFRGATGPGPRGRSRETKFIVGYQGALGTGKEAFVARARELAAKYGDRFLPPDSLT